MPDLITSAISKHREEIRKAKLKTFLSLIESIITYNLVRVKQNNFAITAVNKTLFYLYLYDICNRITQLSRYLLLININEKELNQFELTIDG